MTDENEQWTIHHRGLERMYLAAPINEFFAPRIEVAEGTATISVDVREAFHHSAGAVHGAALFKSLDDAAFFAVASLVPDMFVLTVSFQTYLTRPVSQGTLIARGRVVHRSRRLFVAESTVVDQDGRDVARGSGSFMRGRMPLREARGYSGGN